MQIRTDAQRRADAARQRKARARRLSKQRASTETLLRRLLDKYFKDGGLHAENWLLASEFFETVRDLLPFEEFVSAVKIDPGIESGILKLAGDAVLMVRPRFFLDGGA